MSAIDKHYDAILDTEVNLLEHAGDEDMSVEGQLEWFVKLTSDNPNSNEHATERKATRRMIVDRMIEQTGGVAKLRQLNIRELGDPKNDIIAGILCDIVRRVAREFVSDPKNASAVDEIENDPQYLAELAQERFDETYHFVTDQVLKREGAIPSDS